MGHLNIKMNKKQLFFNLLYVVLIVGLLIFMVWIVNFMKTESKECMFDPINYFETKNEGASCSCIKNGVVWPETRAVIHGKSSHNSSYINFNFTLQD